MDWTGLAVHVLHPFLAATFLSVASWPGEALGSAQKQGVSTRRRRADSIDGYGPRLRAQPAARVAGGHDEAMPCDVSRSQRSGPVNRGQAGPCLILVTCLACLFVGARRSRFAISPKRTTPTRSATPYHRRCSTS
ncbi:uncharacterized protein PSFLO_06024 [Pseudozyma flocculosa]|uniref:Uncharacterized protein n=1 Tax=Pseudozyma flocculosa TaxID=84751 RepID=A0A5C3F850_9BASI|nr:uncharacterized protein PSFLO_06024 [Pseudozyma flocculosa]